MASYSTSKLPDSGSPARIAMEDLDDVDEELTAAEVFNQLQRAWLNEKFSPELLVQRSDLIVCVLDELNKIEVDVKQTSRNTFEGSLKQMEVERIRYIVSNYLRSRLQKIERFIFTVLEEDEKRKSDFEQPKLSQEETRYATEYRKDLEEYLNNTALQHMTRNSQSLQPKQIAAVPNMEQFVFLRVNNLVKDVSIQDPLDETREEVFDLEPNTQHIMPYKAVASFVKSSDVCLM